MMYLRCHLLYNVLIAAIATNGQFAVAFAQAQSRTAVLNGFRPRPHVVAKAVTMSEGTASNDFEPNVIHDEEKRTKAQFFSRQILRRRNVLTAIVFSPLCFFFFSRRECVSSFFSGVLLEGYKSSLVRHPLRTKVLTGSTLSLVGDRLAQIRESGKGYDVRRAVSFAAFDCCYRMFQHVAIPTIVRLGQGKMMAAFLSLFPFIHIGSSSMAFCTAMERTMLYQFGVIPFFYYPVFFSFTGVIQGLSPTETLLRARSNFFMCWKRNLIFWIPAQLVMFGLVDEKWQIPFVCVMGILWSLILSVTAGKAKKSLSS